MNNGEVIKIKISAINSEKTLVNISSKPSIPLTLVDYGKNHENILAIKIFLLG